MALTKPRAYQIFNLDYKQAVRVLTDSDINLSGGAPNSVDGVNLVADDRVLVRGQSTGSQNGIYIVDILGTGSNGTWIRSVDANQTGEIQAGMIVMVTEGNSYKDTQWKLTTNDPITIGVTTLTFELNTSTNQILNGNTNITIDGLGANANVSVNGAANVAVFTPTGLIANNISTDGNIVVGNNLVVNGNLTYINVTDLNIEDPIIGLGRGPNNTPLTTDDNKDRGTQLWYYTTEENSAFIGWDDSAGKIIAAANVTISNEIVAVNNFGALVVGNLESSTTSASGNITAGNLITSGALAATGNATAGNILSSGLISATGNVTGGNIRTVGTVSATGNIVGNYILGNGSQLTGLPESYGNSNVSSLLASFGSNTISTTGNISAGYFLGDGSQLTNLPVQPGTYSNANVANFLANSFGSNTISTTGNITAANFLGNIAAANVVGTVANASYADQANTAITSNTVTGSAQGNITSVGTLVSLSVSGNIQTANNISATGNITGNYFLGNGSQLTGLPATYTDANVTTLLANLGSNVISGTGTITTTANISGNYFIGNGSLLTGIDSTYGNSNVAALLANFGSNTISSTGNITSGNLLTSGLISATSTITSSANIVGGNLLTSGQLSATVSITAGNIFSSGIISTAGNVNAVNVIATNLTGTLTTAAQTNITLLGTLSSLSVSGNVQGGNLRTVGLISAAGNVQGGNIIAAANVEAGNITTLGLISAAGNVTGNYFIGDGSQLTGISASSNSISNGTSNVVIATANGNISMHTNGQDTVEVSPGELTVYGVFSNPKTISSNVVIGPDINSMLIGPISVDPNNNIFVPTGSTLNII